MSLKYHIYYIKLCGVNYIDTKHIFVMSEIVNDVQVEAPKRNVCTYKIVKGIRKGQECGIVMQNADNKFCYKHRVTIDIRRKAVEKLQSRGLET